MSQVKGKKSSNYGLLSVIILVLFGSIFLAAGIWGRSLVLDANPCEMTYTSRERKNVNVNSTIEGYKLYKYSNPKSLMMLNPHPVLFIPGHMGTADQVRSLSSTMHNGDGYFQYFSLDLNYSLSAIHGSTILTQAMFTNDALLKIASLYDEKSKNKKTFKKSSKKKKGIKIIIVGHSIGGMVARTSMLLDNHPHCVVSDIVMMGTPIEKPSYTPDSSLDILYSKVNKAWKESYYNESYICRQSLRRHNDKLKKHLKDNTLDEFDEEEDDSPVPKKSISANWDCPVCPRHTRLVSVSGGDIDILVNPTLTRLEIIAPIPKNITVNRVVQSAPILSTIIKPVQFVSTYLLKFSFKFFDFILYSYDGVTGMLFPNNSTNINITDTNDTLTNICINETCNNEEIISIESTNSSIDNNSSDEIIDEVPPPSAVTSFETITAEHWDTHMRKQSLANHITIRSSQFKSSAYPIDHTAILWCRDFIGSLSSAMRELVITDSNSSITVNNLFSLNSGLNLSSYEDMIPQVKDFVVRNDTLSLWNEAATVDRVHMLNSFPYFKSFMLMAFMFLSRHITYIGVCYTFISCLTLSVPLLRGLSGHSVSQEEVNDWRLLQPSVHLHFEIVIPAIQNFIKYILGPPLHTLVSNSLSPLKKILALIGFIIPKMIYDIYFTKNGYIFYHLILEWIASYGIAIGIRCFLMILIYSFRSLYNVVTSVLCTLARLTIWNKNIRNFFKWCMKKVPSVVKNSIRSTYKFTFFMTCWAMLALKFVDRVNGKAGIETGLFILLITILMLTGIVLIYFICILLSPPEDSDSYHNCTQLVLLYWPLIGLVIPTFGYAISLLLDSSNDFSASIPLFDMFHSGLLSYILFMVVIYKHLSYSRVSGYSSISKVDPLLWLVDLFGPDKEIISYPTSSSSSSDISIPVGDKSCIHEDGGKDAIYEEIIGNEDDQITICPDVVMGSTFRVISCNCSKNLRLKLQSEWCEWCLCRKCGGKNLPKVHHDFINPQTMSDFSMNLVLFFSLIIVSLSTFVYTIDHPYKHLYIFSAVASMHLLRDFGEWLTRKL
jgi:hypothetical protein